MSFALLARSYLFGLVAACSASSVIATEASPILFSWGDQSYKVSDFTDGLQDAAYQVEAERYEKMQRLADSMLLELHLKSEADKQGSTISAVAEKLLATPPPSDSEISKFYEENKANINQPLEMVKDQIVGFMLQQGMEKKRSVLVAELKAKQPFKLSITPPHAPVLTIKTEGYPFKGAENASVTLIIFADYQCPHCKMESAELKKLMAKYGDKVKMVYRDFPINKSGISTKVAEGAECAFQQGKFWEYHDMAFELQAGLDKNSPNDFAEALELDTKKFAQCLSDPATARRIEDSKAEAMMLHVTATPTVFINGRKQSNQGHGAGLEAAIKTALAN